VSVIKPPEIARGLILKDGGSAAATAPCALALAQKNQARRITAGGEAAGLSSLAADRNIYHDRQSTTAAGAIASDDVAMAECDIQNISSRRRHRCAQDTALCLSSGPRR